MRINSTSSCLYKSSNHHSWVVSYNYETHCTSCFIRQCVVRHVQVIWSFRHGTQPAEQNRGAVRIRCYDDEVLKFDEYVYAVCSSSAKTGEAGKSAENIAILASCQIWASFRFQRHSFEYWVHAWSYVRHVSVKAVSSSETTSTQRNKGYRRQIPYFWTERFQIFHRRFFSSIWRKTVGR